MAVVSYPSPSPSDPSLNHAMSDSWPYLDTSPLSPATDRLLPRALVVGFFPFVGYVTILLSEHPWLKTVMLGIMGLVVVLQRE